MEEPNVDWTAIVAEHKIQEAIEAGQFKNLRGAGEPLPESVLATSAFDRISARVMKESGVLPDWMQFQRDIEAEVKQLKPYRERMIVAIRRTPNAATRDRMAERLRAAHKERMELVNLLVLKYNMASPAAIRRMYFAYKLKDEMAGLETEIEDALQQAEKRRPTTAMANGARRRF